MNMKNGLVPTILGTAVAATGLALKNSNLPNTYRNGLIGFGVANILLGSAEMVSSNMQGNNMVQKVTKAVSNMSMNSMQ
ncbi:MAG: hypothetical protein K0Q97_1261 [Bacillota bacterium]|jgi:hypothetical protein|nr:hypothetical protein [Bacillota bacterium]